MRYSSGSGGLQPPQKPESRHRGFIRKEKVLDGRVSKPKSGEPYKSILEQIEAGRQLERERLAAGRKIDREHRANFLQREQAGKYDVNDWDSPTPTRHLNTDLGLSDKHSHTSQSSTGSAKNESIDPGAIYVLHDPTSNHVKIGYSIAGIDKRLQAVQKRCGRPKSTLYFETEANIPEWRLRRLEKLIHWDLNYHQEVYECPCGDRGAIRKHREWFSVSPRTAQQTVEMWHRYVQGDPHKDDHLLMVDGKDASQTDESGSIHEAQKSLVSACESGSLG